ncbi:hypothetical protein ABZ949_05310 [Micromonospora tulbaghiae]|uniref:HNH endonuclease n=1 Tax=Micromonospora tulbaghiae TaxID=479978 RepID=UPI0033D4BCE3
MWHVLAADKAGRVDRDRLDRLQAAWSRLMSTAARARSDGYLTAYDALDRCHGRTAVLDALCTAVLDRPPILHRQGDDCECLGDGWIDGYAYRIHGFLKRNPSKRENERERAKRADRRDRRLRALVLERDGWCCRYCGSGPLNPKVGRHKDQRQIIELDHVDPDQPATPGGGNYVTACKRCNVHKGNNIPEGAYMVLRPVPTDEEKAAWARRGLRLFDLELKAPPEAPADRPQTSDEPATNQAQNHGPVAGSTDGPTDGPIRGPDPGPTADTTGEVRPDQPRSEPEPATQWSGRYHGSGRAGHPVAGGDPSSPYADQPPRSAAYPDIYHRGSRAPSGPVHPGPLP